MDSETGTATGTAAGTLTLEELKEAAKAIWSHPHFNRATILWDLYDATVSLTTAEIAQLANFAKAGSTLRAPARVAFVVSGDHEFGIVRMFQAYREQVGIEIGVFRDHLAATDWLRG